MKGMLSGGNDVHCNVIGIDVVTAGRFSKEFITFLGDGFRGSQSNKDRNDDPHFRRVSELE